MKYLVARFLPALPAGRRADRGQQSPAGASSRCGRCRMPSIMPLFLLVIVLLLLGVLAGLGLGWWAEPPSSPPGPRTAAARSRGWSAKWPAPAPADLAAAPGPSRRRRRPAVRSRASSAAIRASECIACAPRALQQMRILSAGEVDAALDDLALIDRLDALFRAGCEMPLRHHHTIAQPIGPGSADAMLLLMPAWTRGLRSHIGIKIVTVFPDNGRALAAVDLRPVSAARRHDRPDRGAARRHHADQAAHRLRLGPGVALSVAARFGDASADDRHRRPGAASHPRPRQGAADPRGGDLGPTRRSAAEALARELAASLPRALGRPVAVRAVADRTAAVAEADVISCATLSKDAAGRRRLAARGPACRPGRRLYARDARERRQGRVARARSMSIPAPAR